MWKKRERGKRGTRLVSNNEVGTPTGQHCFCLSVPRRFLNTTYSYKRESDIMKMRKIISTCNKLLDRDRHIIIDR